MFDTGDWVVVGPEATLSRTPVGVTDESSSADAPAERADLGPTTNASAGVSIDAPTKGAPISSGFSPGIST
jgi:hypothetical protein